MAQDVAASIGLNGQHQAVDLAADTPRTARSVNAKRRECPPVSARAHTAAREVGDPDAVAAARAAGRAAGVAHMAAHARGAAAYAARAAGLAAPRDPTAVADEVRCQQNLASTAVRDVLRPLPTPTRPAGHLGVLISEMHTRLTTGG
jgi:hypothetical protein